MTAPTDQQAEEAVRLLLHYIGDDPSREGLRDTPRRVAKAMKEMTSGLTMDAAAVLGTTFSETCDEMVVVRGIEFASVCEHHLLPFVGSAVVGYLPGDKVVGLSKIPRLVEALARRPQLQERLTDQIATTMARTLDANGVGVVLRAHHSCMGCRGVRQPNAEMVTSAMLGAMRDNAAARSELMGLL